MSEARARRALGLLGLARRGGRVRLGRDDALRTLRSGRARAVVLAADAGADLRRALDREMRTAGSDVTMLVIDAKKTELGRALGRESLGVAVLTDEGLSNEVRRIARGS